MSRDLTLALCLFAGAISAPPAMAAPAGFDVEVRDPYVQVTPPSQPNAAAYMGLENTGANPHTLVAAESPISETVELHTHVEEGGVLKMRMVPRIELPPNSATALEPGGLHVMFIGLVGELRPGESVPFNLVFDDGSRIAVLATVTAADE